MGAPTPYILFDGVARDALPFYAAVFGGEAVLHTFGDFGRSDGPSGAIAHGMVVGGSVELFGADAGSGDRPFAAQGMMFSLLGSAAPEVQTAWFAELAAGGTVVDELQERSWGAFDGQVIDRFGLRWLLGWEPELTDEPAA